MRPMCAPVHAQWERNLNANTSMGQGVCDHWKNETHSTRYGALASSCSLPSGKRLDVILYGFGKGGRDVGVDVSFVCVEAHARGFAASIKDRADTKTEGYKQECESLSIDFMPFVLGSHGGFGKDAKALWNMFVKKAEELSARDWRHAWSSMSFSSVWLQKLSIAINSVSSTAALQRAPLFTRLTVLGESGEGGESGDWVGVRLADGG